MPLTDYLSKDAKPIIQSLKFQQSGSTLFVYEASNISVEETRYDFMRLCALKVINVCSMCIPSRFS